MIGSLFRARGTFNNMCLSFIRSMYNNGFSTKRELFLDINKKIYLVCYVLRQEKKTQKPYYPPS